LSDAAGKALSYFEQGYSCAESTYMGLCDAFDITDSDAPASATAFGGGIGPELVCGCVCGSMLVIGHFLGRRKGDLAPAHDCQRAVSLLVGRFRERFGTVICPELLDGLDISPPGGLEEYRRRGLKHSHCVHYMRLVTSITEEILAGFKPKERIAR